MTDTVKKRGWVKNAAIIFLAVMLVLTFFSNTIMNRSLPEVAAQYVTSGSITTSIRGTGTVAAVTSYNVELSESAPSRPWPSRSATRSKWATLLFTLDPSDTGTLQDQLDAAKLAYHRR
jgi:hypothetical protein